MIAHRHGQTVIKFPTDLQVIASRGFGAPMGLVFDVLWKEEHLRRTIAPFGEQVTVCSVDLRVGGDYHYVFVTDEGVECSFKGTFLEVEPPTRTVQTWRFEGWPGVEAVESMQLEEAGGGTTLTWTLTFRDQAGRDHMKLYDGIEANLDNIDAYLQTLLHSAVPATDSIGDWLHQGTSDPGEVAQRYDDWAQSYDDDLASWSYQAPGVVADTVLTRHPAAGSVLDVGCGTGLVGQALRARGFAGRLLGLDISQASLDLAREGGAYDWLERADLQQRLPLDDDSVDAVVCCGVMTYLPEVEAVWREFARVSRSGGLVVATQREDIWDERECQAVVDRLQEHGVWAVLDVTGPAPYLPEGYGDTPAVACYYLTALVS